MASDAQRSQGELLLYQQDGRDIPIQVRLDGDTVWLSQKQLAELYDVSTSTINEHISNIYDDAEQVPGATIRKFRIVQTEGTRQVRRLIDHPLGSACPFLSVKNIFYNSRKGVIHDALKGRNKLRPYEDIFGFCKSGTLADIHKHDYVLIPRRYIRAAEQEYGGKPFEENDTVV